MGRRLRGRMPLPASWTSVASPGGVLAGMGEPEPFHRFAARAHGRRPSRSSVPRCGSAGAFGRSFCGSPAPGKRSVGAFSGPRQSRELPYSASAACAPKAALRDRTARTEGDATGNSLGPKAFHWPDPSRVPSGAWIGRSADRHWPPPVGLESLRQGGQPSGRTTIPGAEQVARSAPGDLPAASSSRHPARRFQPATPPAIGNRNGSWCAGPTRLPPVYRP